ncbi:MAG: sulfite exporter TauE/SafE family protein [DPANN group archaeon]|nr:sulfite exporter TauE/SafE family protein [DPANN group archaeon]
MNKTKLIKKGFIAEGMTCTSCESIIKRQVMKVKGVKSVSIDYVNETGSVTFDANQTDIDAILDSIEAKGYTCFIAEEGGNDSKGKVIGNGSSNLSNIINNKTFGAIFSIIGLLLVGYFVMGFVEGFDMPALDQNMSYGLLFLVGIMTGFHCVGMCGGFVVSYTAKDAQNGVSSYKSHFKYGSGKLISYTVMGALFGLLGSIIAFTPMMRGVAGIIAGLFLILYGLKMLNIFPSLRKFSIRMPKSLSRFIGKEESKNASNPFVIGLLNGLMLACGPLQAIYIMAAGSGSMIEGAKLLFVFALGTLPVMLGFGYITSKISLKMTHNILKASGLIVMLLGIFMLNNGLVLTGSGYDVGSIMVGAFGISPVNIGSSSASSSTSNSASYSSKSVIEMDSDGYQVIRMDVDRYGWSPDKFVLKKGVPVRWIIDGLEITGCNNAIQVPKYGLEFDIKKGEQVIEFTPDEVGVIRWSCWMGMIPGMFIVQDDVDLSSPRKVQDIIDSAPANVGGSCGGSGGGCGCGG